MQYQIRESSRLNKFTLLLYGLTLLAVIIFISSLWLKILLSLLLVLWLISDLRRPGRHDPMALVLHDKTGSIEMIQSQDREQYAQFRLFVNRWFLILQLKSKNRGKNLVLIPDRFRSMREYLHFRYRVITMSRN